MTDGWSKGEADSAAAAAAFTPETIKTPTGCIIDSLSLLYASSIVSVSHTLILLLYYRILINSLSVVVVVANRWKICPVTM